MGEGLQREQGMALVTGAGVVRATQVAREAEVRQSGNGVRFATYGETGVAVPDLTSMLEAVPSVISQALQGNTYFFVPLALRESAESVTSQPGVIKASTEPAMIAGEYTDEFSDAAICHREVELGNGHRGVFISTRLMNDRFALSFEFFINVAHAYVDAVGVPERFSELAWQQALANVRGETSMDAWESRSLALGRSPQVEPEPPNPRRRRTYAAAARAFTSEVSAVQAAALPAVADEKERQLFLESAFSDALAIYLLSLSLDFDYSELREREYPLLAPAALAARLKLVAEIFPPNAGYEFALRYKRRA
jgi:hypothetical protein